MNVLIIGSGGREHALTRKIAQSELLSKLYVMPGNPGTEEYAVNVAIDPLQFADVAAFCLDHEVELVVVGPEVPLVEGIADYLEKEPLLKDIKIVGPRAAGASLEGSKDFAKRFMQRHRIPTAGYATFNTAQKDEAIDYLERIRAPYVIKADGLAAGKGVLITERLQEAKAHVHNIFDKKKFGDAGSKIVIEEYLQGTELSVFVLTDGSKYVILPEAKDYKRIGEGDTGLNTGGMGAVSPVPFADKHFMKKVEQEIIKPTIDGLQQEAIPYCGFIFFGLMKSGDQPYVVEYNCRLGDPEAEVVLPRLEDDLLDLCLKAAKSQLDNRPLRFKDQVASTFVLVSGGYPEKYEKGFPVQGLSGVDEDIMCFHAGTKRNDAGELVNAGGRVLALTGMGETLEMALNKTRLAAESVSWNGRYYRRDIGHDLLP